MHVSYFHEHLLTFVGLLTQVHRLRVPEERPTLECIGMATVSLWCTVLIVVQSNSGAVKLVMQSN